MERNVDNIKTWISILGPAVIFISILKAMLFYNAFAIRITDFIEFSEALLLFFNDIIITVAAVSGGIFFLFLFRLVFPRFSKQGFSLEKNEKDAFLSVIINRSYFLFTYLGLLIAGILLFRIFYYYYSIDLLYAVLIAISCSVFLSFPLIVFYQEKSFVLKNTFINDRFGRMLRATQLLPIGFFIVLIVVANLFGVHQKLRIIYSGKSLGHIKCISVNKDILQTTADTLYLGRTRNNILFYLRNENKSIVIDSKDFQIFEIEK